MSAAVDELELAMVAKIEALFRKANHPNTGPAEREAFQAKALALMTKHRIQTVETDQESDARPEDVLFGKVPGSYAPAHHSIISSVCKVFACRTYFHTSGRPGDPARTIYIFGFKRDADKVIMLSRLFIEDAKLQASRYRSNDPNSTIRWRKSFMQGYGYEVAKRFDEAKRQLDSEQADWAASSGALVLVARATQVEDAYKTKTLRAHRQTARGSAEGFAAGQAAGRNSNVGRSRLPGTSGALTA